jgi:hypothetical protein
MPTVHYYGPKPPPGYKWCFVCAFAAKLVINKANPEVESPTRDMTFSVAENSLNVAVATGIYPPLANFGPLDLCWDHLGAINITNVLPAQAGMMPPAPPPGGIPLLGQPRG